MPDVTGRPRDEQHWPRHTRPAGMTVPTGVIRVQVQLYRCPARLAAGHEAGQVEGAPLGGIAAGGGRCHAGVWRLSWGAAAG
jgi:hypothetical protein